MLDGNNTMSVAIVRTGFATVV
ncbi:MAG: hypothetical protein QOI08_2860, partial [Actinomycetota bacterium]|nr:hypothetical protein [Actinomycetota bacterium]